MVLGQQPRSYERLQVAEEICNEEMVQNTICE